MNAILTYRNPAVPCTRGFLKRLLGNGILLLATLALFSAWNNAHAADPQPLNALQDISFAGLPGNQVQITLQFNQPASNPASFTIDNPARIAFDLPATKSALAKRSQPIGIGPAKSITAVEVKGRTRVVLNLFEMVPYETRTEGDKIIVVLGGTGATTTTAAAAPAPAATAAAGSSMAGGAAITNIDFRRGDQGEGRIIVTLSNPAIPVDMSQEAGKVVLDFHGASLPENLQRRLDVTDFATPVKLIDTETRGDNVRLEITPTGEYEHLAYQTDNQFTVEIRPTTKEEKELRQKKEFGYTGERLSLNFQDIEVRAVLQLLADFTGTNIVVSDTVSGNLTLRMQNVPWDQALDIVLKTKGLAKRDNGNVMLIAPGEEIAAREKLELESQKQIEELAPLYSDFIQVNYAKAEDIATLLKSDESSLMSERGNAIIDERTNTLLIQDTADKLEEVRKLVALLDIPVRQVLIESRIVIANNDFSRDLGVRFGASGNSQSGRDFIVGGGTRPGNVDYGFTPGFEVPAGSGNDGLLVDLPVANPSGAIGIALGKIGSSLIQLELSAMQLEDRGEVISSPRVITSNQQEAIIQQGVEIPYQQATSSGATSVSFKEAVLQLKVTPQITPDDRIIMDLQVNKDSVGEIFAGVPSIDTRNVSTRVLVDNGETLVLGGIYEQAKGKETERVPFFGELPGVGWLFKTEAKTDEKQELLIFVTPKIIKQGMALN
ncbi:MAG TPA: type IV pilus secretin PilQ [Gammaproteobacteria bacterium]|nr:type IV pilus secretin PilQ [Gammaproteobacteria bacterium]